MLAGVQALDVGVGVDANGVGLVGLPERGRVAERDSVSTLAERLHGGHCSYTGIEDARGRGAGGLCRGDLDLADILGSVLGSILRNIPASVLRNFGLTPVDASKIGLAGQSGRRGGRF